MSEWLPILEYREFYDLPRAFVLKRNGRMILFDCPFDEAQDECDSQYTVYELASTEEEVQATPSWASLVERGSKVGQVAVSAVVFDATKRAAVSSNVFDDIE